MKKHDIAKAIWQAKTGKKLIENARVYAISTAYQSIRENGMPRQNTIKHPEIKDVMHKALASTGEIVEWSHSEIVYKKRHFPTGGSIVRFQKKGTYKR